MKKNPKPQLAAANQPFTPMSHKDRSIINTPYHPLQLDDLATPKITKSKSNLDKVNLELLKDKGMVPQEIPKKAQPQPIPSKSPKPQQQQPDLFLIKTSLLSCIQAIERLEKSKKTYASVSTQCQMLPPKAKSQRRQSTNLENVAINQYEVEKGKNQFKPKTSQENGAKNNVDSRQALKRGASANNLFDGNSIKDQINSISTILQEFRVRIDQIEQSKNDM